MHASDEAPILRKHGLAEVRVGTSIVLYDADAERSHLLNPSAASIWDLIDGATGAEAITERLIDAHPGSELAIRDGVRTTLDHLLDEKLTGHAPVPLLHPRSDELANRAATDDPSAIVASPRTDLATFGALEFSFAVDAPEPFAAEILRALRSLQVPGPPDHVYTLIERDDQFVGIELDGRAVTKVETADILGYVLLHANQQACARHDSALLLHASGVLTASGVVALVGSMDAGKSTLVTALVQAGYPYVTDEAIAVDLDDLEVEAYPKPIGLDEGSHHLFTTLEGVRVGFADRRWWINPLDAADGAAAVASQSRHPIAAIVFVQYRPEGELTVRRPSAPEAVLTLTRNLFNLGDHGAPGLQAAARLVERVEVFELEHSGLDDAVTWFGRTFA